jgi:hypothetical protein
MLSYELNTIFLCNAFLAWNGGYEPDVRIAPAYAFEN